MLACIIIDFFTREAYLLRACSILMLIGTFAGVHFYQFLYERSITLQNLFYFDVNRNFCWCALRSVSLQRSITLQSPFYLDITTDFCYCALSSISLTEKHISSEPSSILLCNRDFCWCALPSISLREKHTSSELVLSWC